MAANVFGVLGGEGAPPQPWLSLPSAGPAPVYVTPLRANSGSVPPPDSARGARGPGRSCWGFTSGVNVKLR
ncbi:Hypothetical predicted protein [Podarcis lilfordi]|uniref:Uncharacterized protein n=1 Tax=Podarcis lilfordi TaxID=74358 RepID=A0AA35PD93_9SAUR|nr:Hypothetical predicted protein [Podarcis lilfordi]